MLFFSGETDLGSHFLMLKQFIQKLQLALLFIPMLCGCRQAAPKDQESGLEESRPETAETGKESAETGSPPAPSFIRSEQDTELYADFSYVLDTYTLHPDNSEPYDSLFPDEEQEDGSVYDHRPTFYLLRPTDSAQSADKALILFHGGTVANDSDYLETKEIPKVCQPDKLINMARYLLDNRLFPISMAVDRGWYVVIPRNDWCDGWLGLGPDDPAASWHYGFYHLQRTLDFLFHEQEEPNFPDTRYGWGTSSGGSAVAYAAAHYGGLDRIIVDSAPSNMVLYHQDDPTIMEFQFGGPPLDESEQPSAFYEAYLNASAHGLVRDGKLRTPMFVPWNSKDLLIDSGHPKSLLTALRDTYTDEGIAFGGKDLAHRSPGSTFHVQSTATTIPGAYTTSALFDFLEGANIQWLEVEDGCVAEGLPPCHAGEEINASSTSPAVHHTLSGGSGRTAAPGSSPGLLWSDKLPEDLPTETPIRALLAIKTAELEEVSGETIVGTLRLRTNFQNKEVDFVASDFYDKSEKSLHNILAQLKKTTLPFQLQEGEEGVLEWKNYGVGRVLLDCAIFTSIPTNE